MVLYRQIAEILKAEISSGRYSRAFPSETQLVKRFAVSRQTVMKAMSELVSAGFVERHRGSGTLVSRKMRQALGRIGLLLPWFMSSPFANIVSHVCRQQGYTLVYSNIEEEAGPSRKARIQLARQLAYSFAEAHVSGVLMQPLQFTAEAPNINQEIVSAFRERRIPVVLVDHDVSDEIGVSGCDVVGIDNFRAGYLIGRHLVACGARKIVFLMREHWAPTVTERLFGVSAAVVAADLSWRPTHNVAFVPPEDVSGIRTLLAQRSPDALVCGNDTEAAKLLCTLNMLKIDVPARVQVTGFDDLPMASLVVPTLTTIHQDFERIASVAAERLFQRMHAAEMPPMAIRLPVKLVVRESTRKAFA